mmetsp:Transcript_40403/g.93747  ORF Transcript_40403/g.93747 Transcript_40403/m.93747 type:complete len:146 (+) Transcript_40403:305-742(+)
MKSQTVRVAASGLLRTATVYTARSVATTGATNVQSEVLISLRCHAKRALISVRHIVGSVSMRARACAASAAALTAGTLAAVAVVGHARNAIRYYVMAVKVTMTAPEMKRTKMKVRIGRAKDGGARVLAEHATLNDRRPARASCVA